MFSLMPYAKINLGSSFFCWSHCGKASWFCRSDQFMLSGHDKRIDAINTNTKKNRQMHTKNTPVSVLDLVISMPDAAVPG